MEYYYQRLDQKEEKQKSSWNIGMILLSLYVLLNYIANEEMLPPSWHSAVMYVFIVWTALGVFVRGKLKIDSYTIWYAVMIGYSALTFLWADYRVDTALYNMIVSMVITLCFMITLDSIEKLERCLWVHILAADVLGIILLATGQLEMAAEAERLGQSVTGNANSFSAMLMVSAIFASWVAIYASGKEKLFSWISAAFLLFLMALSGGRKTVLAVVMCLAYFTLSNHAQNASLNKKLAAALKTVLVVVAAYFAIMEIPLLYDMIGNRFENLFSLLSGGESEVSSDALRQKMVENGLKAWVENPLWGYGLDTCKYYNYYTIGRFYYAHNNFVELLYDLGLIGFCLYYGYYIYIAKKLKAMSGAMKKYQGLGFGILIGCLVYDIGGVSYYTVLMQIMVCLVACIVRNASHEMRKTTSSERIGSAEKGE